MPSVDNRVVEMQFNNKQFENGVSTTLNSLKRLKDGLNFKKSTQSLNELENAGKRFNLSNIATGVENIQKRFSALGVIGVTALANITNSAVNAGKRITEALTIRPIKMGFEEYETQINAVQTILANTSSKGTTLNQVNDALDELNRYADMTIYNFTEMTRNIGTFTAAGVDLDTSVSAIKGIANLAAVSGSTSQQAATAMYQLSQALAAGSVKLMDWNSVVNAGMGGQVFQDALKETARVHGIKIDEMIKKEGSFRETLKDGWLTSAILTETLAKFTGDLTEEQLKAIGYNDTQIKQIMEMGKTANDAATKVKTFTQLFDTLGEALQSGWTQSWEYIIGDFEEAKASLTTLSDLFSGIINDSANARNEVLKEWSEAGGRQDLFDGLLNSIYAVISYIKPMQEGFREIIPQITGQKLVEITKGFKEFTESLKLSEENSKKVKNIGKNIAKIFKPLLDILSGIGKGLPNFFKGLGDLGSGFLSIVESITGFLGSLSEGIHLGDLFAGVVSTIGSGLGILAKGASGVALLFSSLTSVINTFFNQFNVGFNNLMNGMTAMFSQTQEVEEQAGSDAGNTAKTIFDNIKEVFIEFIKSLPELISTTVKSIGEAISIVMESINVRSIIDTIGSLFMMQGAKEFKGFFKGLREKVEDVDKITISFKSLTDIVDKVSEVLDSLKNTINTFTASIRVNILLKIAIAIGILASSLYALSKIPPDRIASSLGILGGGLGIVSGLVIGIMAVLKKLSNNIEDMKKVAQAALIFRHVAISLVILSAAILILSKSVKSLSELNWEELLRGIGGVAAMAGVLIALSKFIKVTPDLIKTAAGLVVIGIALRILVSSIKSLGQMSWEDLIKGIGGLVASLSIFIGMMDRLSETGRITIRSATALVVLTIALKILASVISDIGSMSVAQIAKGVVGLAASLIILSGAVNSIKIEPGVAGRFIAFTFGITLLADSIKQLGSMSIKEVAKSLLTLYASLLIVTKAMNNLQVDKGVARNFFTFAMGLAALIAPIAILGYMDFKNMIQGLVGLAAALAIITYATKALKPLTKELMEVSKSLGIFGLAMITFGLGMTAIVQPIKALAELSVEQLIKSITSMALVIYGLYSLIQSLNDLPKVSPKTLATLGLMVVVVGAIGFILDIMSLMDADATLKSAASLSLLLMSVSAALAILTAIPLPAALTAVGTLAAVIAGVAAIVVAAGGLAQIPGAKWLVSEGRSFLQSIGEAIGAFFGGIAGGAISAVASTLPDLGNKLSQFAQNAKPFFEAMQGFDASVGEGVKNLAIAFLALTGANIAEAATSWFAGEVDLAEFGKKLAEFGPYLKQFGDSVSGIDGQAIKDSAEAAKGLVDIANAVPKSGGLVQMFEGEGNILEFAQQLIPFGLALKLYSLTVKGLDVGAIRDSADAAQALVDVANALPKFGGLVQLFEGQGSLTVFTQQLIPFGLALRTYSLLVSGMKVDAIKSSAEGAKGLTDVFNALPKTGGLTQVFEGEGNALEFAKQLPIFGLALRTYSFMVSGIKVDAIRTSADAARALVEVYNALEKDGGLSGLIDGERDFSGFARNVEALGNGLGIYIDKVKDIKPEQVNASVDVVKGLSEVYNNIGDVSKTTGMSGFAAGLNYLGECIAQYAGHVAEIKFDNVGASAEALKQVYDAVSPMGDTEIGDLSSFTSQLGLLGLALRTYSIFVSDLDVEAVNSSSQAVKSLVDIYNSLNTSGGIIEWFTGERDFKGFGENIKLLGEAMQSYSSSVTGLDVEAVSASVDAIRSLADVKNSLGSDGGQVFNVLSGLSSAIKLVGPAINDYVSNVSEVDFSNVEASTTALGQVRDIVNSMNGMNTDGIIRFANTIGNLGDFGLATFNEGLATSASSVASSLKSLAEAISTGAGEIGTAIETLRNKLNNETTTYEQAGKNIGESLDRGMANAIEAGGEEVIGKLKALCDKIKKAATDALNDTSAFKSYGKGIVDAVMQGINESNYYTRFYNAGKSMAQGVKDGLNDASARSSLISAAVNMASSAANAFTNKLNINSPSKVFRDISKSIPEGVAVGIAKWTNLASNASKKMADKTFETTRAAMSRVTDLISNPRMVTGAVSPVYVAGSTQQMATNAMLTSRLAAEVSRAAEKISNNQNGSNSVVNNYDETTININGATINDNEAMRQATKNYLIELSRLGAM